MKLVYKKKRNGFTLLELLIVISIIAVLTGISIFSMQGARKQGRDGDRKSDLETIRSALELYRADCNKYPSGSGNAETVLGSPFTGSVGSCNTNTYLKTTPKDPSSVSYSYSSGGTNYELCTTLEDPGTVMTCTSCASCNYKVENP